MRITCILKDAVCILLRTFLLNCELSSCYNLPVREKRAEAHLYSSKSHMLPKVFPV